VHPHLHAATIGDHDCPVARIRRHDVPITMQNCGLVRPNRHDMREPMQRPPPGIAADTT
jgi:hypothetical protein